MGGNGVGMARGAPSAVPVGPVSEVAAALEPAGTAARSPFNRATGRGTCGRWPSVISADQSYSPK
jgi:hypothetical protein